MSDAIRRARTQPVALAVSPAGVVILRAKARAHAKSSNDRARMMTIMSRRAKHGQGA